LARTIADLDQLASGMGWRESAGIGRISVRGGVGPHHLPTSRRLTLRFSGPGASLLAAGGEAEFLSFGCP
jgi:hypothetical protein